MIGIGSAHLSLQAVQDETNPVIKIGQHIHCTILALFPKKLDYNDTYSINRVICFLDLI